MGLAAAGHLFEHLPGVEPRVYPFTRADFRRGSLGPAFTGWALFFEDSEARNE